MPDTITYITARQTETLRRGTVMLKHIRDQTTGQPVCGTRLKKPWKVSGSESQLLLCQKCEPWESTGPDPEKMAQATEMAGYTCATCKRVTYAVVDKEQGGYLSHHPPCAQPGCIGTTSVTHSAHWQHVWSMPW